MIYQIQSQKLLVKGIKNRYYIFDEEIEEEFINEEIELEELESSAKMIIYNR